MVEFIDNESTGTQLVYCAYWVSMRKQGHRPAICTTHSRGDKARRSTFHNVIIQMLSSQIQLLPMIITVSPRE